MALAEVRTPSFQGSAIRCARQSLAPRPCSVGLSRGLLRCVFAAIAVASSAIHGAVARVPVAAAPPHCGSNPSAALNSGES